MADEPSDAAPEAASAATPNDATPAAPSKKLRIPPGLSTLILAAVGIVWLVVAASAGSVIALIPGVLFLGAGLMLAMLQYRSRPEDDGAPS